MTDVPHFSLPFRFGFVGTNLRQAAVNEQDSIDEIADCVQAILLCPLGFRLEVPSFGIPDPTFRSGVDIDEMRTIIRTWEPRASVLMSAAPDRFDELLQHVETDVQVQTEE
jgi:phage baseplate assembly protein W